MKKRMWRSKEYGAFSTAIWDCSDEKEIAGDHPDADGLGSGVCLLDRKSVV